MSNQEFPTFARVRGFSGVACVVLGPTRVWEPIICFQTDEDGNGNEGEMEVETGEGEFVDGDGTRLRVRMVGDDTVHEVDADYVEGIDEEDFCGGCGQIGCGWH